VKDSFERIVYQSMKTSSGDRGSPVEKTCHKGRIPEVFSKIGCTSGKYV